MAKSRGAWAFVASATLMAGQALAQEFERHVVVAQEGHAARAGRELLRAGGNAIDAAVGTALALAVTHPAAGNLGGGGFIVAFLADRKQVVTVDFRELAPNAATPTMYLGPDGRTLPHHRAGPRAAGVPGTVRGLGLAHEKFGKLPWKDIAQPAVRLAREGFEISGPLARSLNAQLFRGDVHKVAAADDLGAGTTDRLADFPASIAAYRKPDGSPWQPGDRLVQPDLAATLERIANHGPDEFYTGETAHKIVAYMESAGGLISTKDLAAYSAKLREPTHTTFRGHDVYGIAPPSSGGIVDAIILNIVERYDLKADGRDAPRTLHRVTEAMRRAYHVRATQIADPDFIDVPTAKLTSKPFADELARTIGDRATPSRELADFPVLDREGANTTHLSTMDASGNAVALTYTLEEGYGSKAVVPGAGFLLNNEMGDFNLIPGRTDAGGRIGTVPNRIAPRKRMLSSQSPTIVLHDGRVRLVTGSPGGRTIPNTVVWVLLNVLEFDLPPQAAVNAPRAHHQWFPDRLVLEGDAWPEGTVARLKALGHAIGRAALQGDAHTIVVQPETGRLFGAPDPRRGTSAAAGD